VPDHDSSRPLSSGSKIGSYKLPPMPPEVFEQLQAAAPKLVKLIAQQIQLEVSAYAGPPNGRRHHLIVITVDKAVTHFLEVLEGKPGSEASVISMARQLGHAEALDGHSGDALRAAHHVASRVAWTEIKKLADRLDLEGHELAPLIDAVFTFIQQLINQGALGHASAVMSKEGIGTAARRQLVTAMLSGKPFEKYEHRLQAAAWDPPSEVVVVTASIAPHHDAATLPAFSTEVLSAVLRSRITLISPPGRATYISQRLSIDPAIASVASSWVVPLSGVRDAHRWTQRALDLAARGVIKTEGVIDCARYRPKLWLYADPALTQYASEEILRPLLSMTPYYRVMLANTMLVWLQVRESAPLMAKRLDTHEQTVRRRLRQLRELFGDQLSDPQNTLIFLSALEVAIPRWRSQIQTRRARTPKTQRD
jgi:hypothetical protein